MSLLKVAEKLNQFPFSISETCHVWSCGLDVRHLEGVQTLNDFGKMVQSTFLCYAYEAELRSNFKQKQSWREALLRAYDIFWSSAPL